MALGPVLVRGHAVRDLCITIHTFMYTYTVASTLLTYRSCLAAPRCLRPLSHYTPTAAFKEAICNQSQDCSGQPFIGQNSINLQRSKYMDFLKG